jgi:hypothetical protein
MQYVYALYWLVVLIACVAGLHNRIPYVTLHIFRRPPSPSVKTAA